jgi:hypothetical protein
MKAVDPTIKVGGPAFAQAWNTADVEAFCKGTAATLDFISYHSYSTGDKNETNQSIYDKADIGWVTGMVKSAWAKYSFRKIEFFHDEYNISYSPPDTKQTNYVSQIFDAIATISLIKAGASAAMAWNECDGWYGKMDNSYNKRPSFYMFRNFNRHLAGNWQNSTQVSDPKKIVAFASNNDSCYYLTVVNRSDTDLNVEVIFKGLPSKITGNTIVENFENQKAGGIVTKNYTLDELTTNGYVSGAGTIALFSIPKYVSTGLKNMQTRSENPIHLYPNPAIDKISIHNPGNIEIKALVIKDITGRIMKNISINETESFNLTNYPKGVYFVEYIVQGKLYSQKFIKY